MAKNYKGCNKPNYVYGYKAKLEYYLREYKTALDNGDLHSMDEYLRRLSHFHFKHEISLASNCDSRKA